MIRPVLSTRQCAVRLCLGVLLPAAAIAQNLTPAARPVTSAQVQKQFADPPREYSSAPLWVWNDMLTEQQIAETMADLAGQKVKQVFVHPRPGLMTPYLSDDWFRLWRVALRQAEKLDMNVWIYDENSYPSGFAGGLVPEAMPESRGKGLALQEVETPAGADDSTIAVFRLTDSGYENITQRVRSGEKFPEGRYLVASLRLAQPGGWFGGKWYVDLLKPGVTEKFIEITMERYRREIGEQFGKRVPGWFTDEPHLAPAGGLHWSDGLPELFEKRWGYDLIEHLPSLALPVGDWKRVRHDYYSLLLEQFIEHWSKPCYEYCEEHNLDFTGHYWEHGWPDAGHGGDNMAMYAWHQRPAIDILMNQYSEDVNAQFGNVRSVKELSSVANQLGRTRTLCEAYGAGGWDLRFEDMKRIGDWLLVLGVNTLDEHLSYITIRGARKRDHPQSFSYHEPWWDAYHVMAEYFTRLSLVMSQGRQVNRILVIEPTTTTWMYQAATIPAGRLREIGDRFQALLMALERAQVEYDVGCEDIIARHGSVDGARFRVGYCTYDTVVLPPLTENLDPPAMALLEAYAQAGGAVLCCGDAPAFVNGSPSDRGQALVKKAGWKRVEAKDVPASLLARSDEGFAIERQKGDKGILFHHRRHVKDGQFLLLVNTSIESPSVGTIRSDRKGVRQWNLNTGKVESYPFEETDEGIVADFKLPPSGSLLLFLSEEAVKPHRESNVEKIRVPALSAKMEVQRVQPNVLTLDYVDITAGGETLHDVYFYRANQFAFQKNGMEHNPWDSAVQLRDQLITKTFPADSGFTASYRFVIETAVPRKLAIVIERTDLYTITCNGKPVSAQPGDWWLDKAFGRIDITQAAKVGENVVTVKAKPFTIYHELEPAYVLGDFTLQPADRGFVIVPDKPLEILKHETSLAHNVNPDGTMWLSGGIAYQGGVEDRAPFVEFDLGGSVDLTMMEIWNYNEGHVRDLSSRGVRELRVLGSATGEPDSFKMEFGTFRLARGGANSPAERFDIRAQNVRFVRFEVLSNQQGVTYPAEGEPADNGFVGLAEVRFFAVSDRRLDDVTIHRVSSELASMGRTADRLVDGSGLSGAKPGWRQQGHPFYSAAVAYRQRFDVGKPKGAYVVSLPDWYGSVAKVNVNGKPAGCIAAPPWECDVTAQIERGQNTIEVVVIGTLKNTLGPHHNGAGLGSAWPGMFQRGPEVGPPPGDEYHTVDYGLFEPFVLTQVVKE
ncbi:MAG TPA: glycosyl hydrolase [Sedimentisphaerales bacterium]|nr:glycosyl hydrolase [Sedimentisphaerales bacterium]HRS10616.1 glycosyl hydrolase [Sedimentisphaerales bacterium]HRV47321.1 glycosyl hydrolase [Sedimentisphaerales bacterium]